MNLFVAVDDQIEQWHCAVAITRSTYFRLKHRSEAMLISELVYTLGAPSLLFIHFLTAQFQ